LPLFVSYRFDILQAGFRDTGEFVDPSTGVGHEATVRPVVQIVQDVQPLRSVQDVEEQAWHKAPGNSQNRSVSIVPGVPKFTPVEAVRLAHPLPPSLRFAPLAINFPAVPDPEDSYPLARVVNVIDNPIIAHPNAPVIFGTR